MNFNLIPMEKQKAVRLGICTALCILVVYLIFIVTGKNGLLDLSGKWAQLRIMEEKNQRLEQKNIELYRIIDRIKHDQSYIEDLTRRELKMIGKDEVIYKFKDETDANRPGKPNGNTSGVNKYGDEKNDKQGKNQPGTGGLPEN